MEQNACRSSATQVNVPIKIICSTVLGSLPDVSSKNHINIGNRNLILFKLNSQISAKRLLEYKYGLRPSWRMATIVRRHVNVMVVGSIPSRGNEIFIIFISSF